MVRRVGGTSGLTVMNNSFRGLDTGVRSRLYAGCDGIISANWPGGEADRPDRRCDSILREIGVVAASGANGGRLPPLSRTGGSRFRIYPEVATTRVFAQRNP